MTNAAPSGYHASDGAAYERFLGRWTERLAKPFADFARVPGDGGMVDVGCGTGSLAAEIARREHRRQVIGVDVSEAYLDFARKRHVAPNLRFQRGDAGRLPFADAEMSGTLAQLVLNFVPDPVAVAREAPRAGPRRCRRASSP
jgi:ubiquinone/menaquinone biosynthesis C-methylase UbiE